jgi:hypothetical protein
MNEKFCVYVHNNNNETWSTSCGNQMLSKFTSVKRGGICLHCLRIVYIDYEDDEDF